MIPGSIANIAMFRGADYTFQDTIYEADGETAQNITGWAMKFTLFEYGDPGTVYLEKSVALGNMVITNAVAGEVEIRFAAADTNSLLAKQYGYSVGRTDSGAVTPFMSSGLFTLVSEPNATS